MPPTPRSATLRPNADLPGDEIGRHQRARRTRKAPAWNRPALQAPSFTYRFGGPRRTKAARAPSLVSELETGRAKQKRDDTGQKHQDEHGAVHVVCGRTAGEGE